MADVAISFEAPDIGGLPGGDEGATDDMELAGQGGEGDAGESGDDGASPEGDGTEPQPQTKEFHAVENGKLSKVAKETIEKLKAENPALAKAVQRALFAEDRFRRELPGGFKEVATLRQTIEQLGGEEGIQGIQGEIQGWKDFDAQFTAGDPKVIDLMTGTPEAQEGFLRIAPAAFEKFRELNADGYSAYVAQVFIADMNTEQVPMVVQLLGTMLNRATFANEAEKQEVTRLHASLVGYLNRLNEFAKKPVNAPAAAKAAPDSRAAELDTREQSLMRREWTSEANAQHKRIFSDAWSRIAKDVPADKQKAILDLYGVRLQQRINAKSDFEKNAERFFSAKQKDGYLRLHASAFKEAVPLALRSAVAEVIGTRKPSANGTPAAKPAANGTPARPANGYTPIAAKPKITEVNNTLTTPSMWQNKQAVMRDGRRVTWQ